MGNTFSTPSSRSLKTEKPLPVLQPVHQGFNPTRRDVQVAVHILMGLRLQAEPGHLPSELALSILAHADYRPRIMSSKADRVDYHCSMGNWPWYLTTPMLPPDFRRARSITLQVLGEDHIHWAAHLGANTSPDMTRERDRTWYEMCILRPLRRNPESSIGGFVHCGGVVQQEPDAVAQEPRDPRIRTGDADPDFWSWDQFLQVNHNGRETWVIRHNGRVSGRSPGELTGENEISFRCFPSRICETYRVDWPAGNTSDVENPRGFQDGEGFLSALMPGDKIAFWAAVEDPLSGITVDGFLQEPSHGISLLEAVIEILYDV